MNAIAVVAPSAELHLKSSKTRSWLRRRLQANLVVALQRAVPEAVLAPDGSQYRITAPDEGALHDAAQTASRVFGVRRVSVGAAVPAVGLEEIGDRVQELATHVVEGRSYRVRVAKRAGQSWSRTEAETSIGGRLRPGAAKVDLNNPDVDVRVEAHDDFAFVTWRGFDGPSGMPVGTQGRALALLSGGFDSPVAAWLMLRRGMALDYVHFRLDCAAFDQAAAVAQELWRRWAAGSRSALWVVELRPVAEAIRERVPRGHRQVVLKTVMTAAADALAERLELPALVTGEAVGQVSTQTLANLSVIDRVATRLVVRPLAGNTKDEIIARSREIGLEDLCARANEVCDLVGSRTAVAATPERVEDGVASLGVDLVPSLVEKVGLVELAKWVPGDEPRLVRPGRHRAV